MTEHVWIIYGTISCPEYHDGWTIGWEPTSRGATKRRRQLNGAYLAWKSGHGTREDYAKLDPQGAKKPWLGSHPSFISKKTKRSP